MDEPDELTSLEVYNTVWPDDAVTIEAVHSFRDSAQDYIDYLVREDGVILGSGAGAIFAYRARRVVTLITVLAGQRRRGAGTALYGAISMWASERGMRELEVSVSGNDPESLSFAQRRGFTEERREVGLVLSLAGVSPPQAQPPAGIEIVTWAQRPELARGMYEVDLETHPDIPGFEDVAVEPFEDWRRAGDSQVGQQSRDDEGGSPIRALEVGLFIRVELPRNELAEDDVGILRRGQHAVTNGHRAGSDQR